jgi:hypothetical protein
MKKTYNKPSMLVVKMQPRKMLTASENQTYKGNYDGSVTIGARGFDDIDDFDE